MSMEPLETKHTYSQTAAAQTPAGKVLPRFLDPNTAEQYKRIRANLAFTLPKDEKCPVIGITGAMRGDGKSTTAINLSYVLAEKKSKVLLIDANLRRPSLAKKLGMKTSPGLTDLLQGKSARMSEFQSYVHRNLYVLPSGEIPSNPSELLGSDSMGNILRQLQEHFDAIVIDLPPVNPVSDTVSVSRFLTGMAVVIREEYTEKAELERCFRQLELAQVRVLGCVMNGAQSGDSTGGKYKTHRYYQYRTGNSCDTAAKK